MFNWISPYNYDFALAAIAIQIILLIFYCAHRNLPIRSAKIFLFLMCANLVMTIADVAACEIDEDWFNKPLWLVYGMNGVYFIAFIARSWALFDFTADSTHAYSCFGRSIRAIMGLPAAMIILMTITAPWTGWIFTIKWPGGYAQGIVYKSIYIVAVFYIVASLICVLIRWHHMEYFYRLSIIGCNAILLVGILIRNMFTDMLVTSFFSILAILIIYLTVQNPDLYRDRKTHLFNGNAMERITKEYLFREIPFHSVVLTVQKYESSKVLYGSRQMMDTMRIFGRWILEQFPEYYVFYFGNGDFMMLKKGTFEDKRAQIIDKLYDRFEDVWTSEETDVTLDMSVLVIPHAVMHEQGKRIDDVIRYAFSNAYVENKRGCVVFDDHMLKNMSRYEAIEAATRKAIDEHRVDVYLQPIYSVSENRVVRAEALARIKDPELGFLSPAEFIRIAEQTGDIMELGRQIFEKVCAFIKKYDVASLGIECINVNLSPVQCMNAQLSGELFAIAEHNDVPLSMIDFEITETFIEDRRIMQNQMQYLHKYGAEFSLDDFGTGTSNITRLLQLPIHIVKLDLGVVWSYFNGESSILPDLVRMFQNANMQIIAEGIETEEMKKKVAGMGCEYEQGYYFSKPIPQEEFIAYLKDLQRILPLL